MRSEQVLHTAKIGRVFLAKTAFEIFVECEGSKVFGEI